MSGTGSGACRLQFACVERGVWAQALRALHSDDDTVRDEAYIALMLAAPAAWGVDLDERDEEGA